MRSRLIIAGILGAILCAALPARAGTAGGRQPGPAPATQVAWSRFVDDVSGTAQIVIADPDGSHVRVLTYPPAGAQDIDPKFSADGRRLLVERDLPDGTVKVLVVHTDGSGYRVVHLGCVNPCAADVSPTWAPDGRHILFTRVVGPFDQVNGSARSAVLFRSDLWGHSLTRISQLGIDGAYEDYIATFAPAGYMVFVRVRNADIKSAVFRTMPNGTTRRLTPWSIDADEASVSQARSGPTKDLIVFETFGHGPPDATSQAVATVSASCRSHSACGSRIRYLTGAHTLPIQNFNPAWSPNGRHIVYVRFSFDPNDTPPARGDIWMMRWNGKNKTPVSRSPLFEFRPAWGAAATD